MDHQVARALRRLPQVDEVLRGEVGRRLLGLAPRWAVLEAVRSEIARLRKDVLDRAPAGGPAGLDRPDAAGAAHAEVNAEAELIDPQRLEAEALRLCRPSLRRVLNATGVVLHTNLGRAPLAPAALQRICDLAGGYSNLEYRLDTGERGSRHDHVQGLLAELTGAEAHLCVNNNAAAVMLMLGGLCAGREVVVSRGELVEIGGSFRVPDVMQASGAALREVGTTNRTHLPDYEGAIGPQTAALLKVHRSNFAQVGFTKEVATAELAELARRRGVLSLCDLGSGALLDLRALAPELLVGLPGEPTARREIAAGCDLVSFSCDKLLGGPQAGVLCGRRDLIERLRRHPLLRALRPDKLTLLALCATLELYRDAGAGLPAVPVLQMLAATEATLRGRAEALARLCAGAGAAVEVVPVRSAVGGGSLPLAQPRSFAVAVVAPGAETRLERALRGGDPPVVARIEAGRLVLDVRTLADAELPEVCAALARALREQGGAPRD